jgi:GMP synthase-like glutamine amidotransferase
MKSNKKVYCSHGHTGEANWIVPLGFELTQNIDDCNIVVFGGGKDVDPGFYGEKPGPKTDAPSNRDKKEKEDFEYIRNLQNKGKDILMVGVCRGAQLGCALSGGKLIQDVSNHHGAHYMSTFDRTKLRVNSIHHQMMFPYNLEKSKYKILGWSTSPLSSTYMNGFNKPFWLPQNFKEVEIVYFSETNFLAVQWHPEMLFWRKDSSEFGPTMKWMQELLLKILNKEI